MVYGSASLKSIISDLFVSEMLLHLRSLRVHTIRPSNVFVTSISIYLVRVIFAVAFDSEGLSALQQLHGLFYIRELNIPAIGEALQEILGFSDRKLDKTVTNLKTVLERSRKM